MKCKKIQKKILTDFIDGELSANLEEKVKKHIKECKDCRDLYNFVKRQIVLPIRENESASISESVWDKIRGKIEKEQERKQKARLNSIFDFMLHVFSYRRPVFVGVSLLLVITVVFLLNRGGFQGDEVNAYVENQAEFLMQLEKEEINGQYEDFLNLGTDIEEYFL